MKRGRPFVFRAFVGFLVALAVAAPATAVTLNPRGLGQVLVYPYYTANAGFGTLVTIVNTTPRGKALKVRFHEGYDGRVVGAFNLYLSPFDTWAGQVFDTGTDADSVAALATNDHSCVAPAFLLPVDPGSGPPRINFDVSAFAGANADGGPTSGARTREGYFDVIEMGELTNATHATLAAITHVDGIPPGCAQIAAAWTTPGGYWTQDATLDLAPPTGGLYGAASIINVAAGLMYTVSATAIDGFSTTVQHSAPDAATPDLNTASPNAGNAFAAFVPVGPKLVEADFTKPEDAISALFMADNLYNDYVADSDIGAQSDFVVTLPTKRFYTDLALLGGSSSRPPFDAAFSAVGDGTSCAPVGVQPWNREEVTPIYGVDFSGPGSGPPTFALCHGVNALTLGTQTSALGSNLKSAAIDLAPLGFKSGWLRIDLVNDAVGNLDSNHRLAATNGLTLLGMPALGFLALDYVNGNVAPGVLANYSGAYPHHAHVTCFNAISQTPCD